MIDELARRAQAALARVSSGLPGQIEFFLERSRTTSVKVYDGRPESVSVAEPQGAGVRYVCDGRSGYAYSADVSLEGLTRLVRRAAENAGGADPDPYAGLPEPPPEGSSASGGDQQALFFREGVSAEALESKIARAVEAESAARSIPSVETVEESVYQDADTSLAVVSSRGVMCAERRSYAALYVSAHAMRGDEMQTGFGFALGREPAELDAETTGLDAGRKAAALLGARPCPTGVYPVILSPEASAAFVGFVAGALDAEAVQRGRSLLAGRMLERVASDKLFVNDDGLHPDGVGSGSFDDEGVWRAGAVGLIEAGVLRSYLHNTYTARRQGEGARSTASASRGSYRSSPSVAPSNLVVSVGATSREELFSALDGALFVQDLEGLHSGANPVTGQFSVGATGFLVQGGALGAPVREVTVASDLLSLLANVIYVGDDGCWVPLYGSVFAPSLAIAEITVSGA